jgi:hypothetical protein
MDFAITRSPLRYAPVRLPLVSLGGRTIVQSNPLLLNPCQTGRHRSDADPLDPKGVPPQVLEICVNTFEELVAQLIAP